MNDWFLISATMLISSALFCTVLMWMMRGNSRPKLMLARISTLISAYVVYMLAALYLHPDFRSQKLEYVYSLVCIALVCLIFIYFRMLMLPWVSNRKPIIRLLCALTGYTMLYQLLALYYAPSPEIYTLDDLLRNFSHPLVLLRLAAFFNFVLLLACNAVRTYAMYLHHKANIASQFSFRENISLAWLPYLIVLYMLYGVWTVFDFFISDEVSWAFVASNFLYTLFYLSINLLGVRQQDIYTAAESDQNRKEDVVAAVSSIPAEIRQKLNNELIVLMEQNQKYRNPELRLDAVARALSTNRTYLSTIIREDFRENFIGFVNGYRIKEAKELLSNGAATLPMAEVAEKVGFKSISSFNTFFKKTTGMSPTQFRKSIGMSDIE